MIKASSKIVKTGAKYNMLTVIKQVDDYIENCGKHRAQFLCKCDCGNTVICTASNLISKTKSKYSCGCVKRFNLREKNPNAKSKQRLYHIWIGMKSRCHNPNDTAFHNYGAKNIEVCKEWRHNYEAFHNWSLENGYNDTLTIDRINNAEGYTPNNCRWVTFKEQANNTSKNHLLTFKGKTQTLTQWAEELNLTTSAIIARLNRGWTIENTLTTPLVQNEVYITIDNETHTLGEWKRIKGYGYGTISTRIRRGWNKIEAVITPPIPTGYKRKNLYNSEKGFAINET